MVSHTSFLVLFCFRFQPLNTLLHIFAVLVTFCYQLLHLQKRKVLSNQLPGLLLYKFPTPNYLVTCIRWACYVLLPVVFIFRREKGLSNQFPGSLLCQFPTNDYLVTYVHWACYVLFPVVIFLEEKWFVKLVSRFTSVLVSNPQLPCYVYSLALLRFVTSCYIFSREKVCQTSLQVYVCISFQPPTTLLYIFAGLVTFCYELLHLQQRKGLSNQFPGSLLCQFPTNDYLVTYVHWACYVLFPVVIFLEEKLFVKLVSRFTSVLVSNSQLPCYVYSLALLRFVTSCYIFSREKVCQTSLQVYVCISFQPTTTLLHMFIGLDTCCFQLLHLQKRNALSNQFSRFTFVLISNPRIHQYIYSLCLLRFCYQLLHLQKGKDLSNQFPG